MYRSWDAHHHRYIRFKRTLCSTKLRFYLACGEPFIFHTRNGKVVFNELDPLSSSYCLWWKLRRNVDWRTHSWLSGSLCRTMINGDCLNVIGSSSISKEEFCFPSEKTFHIWQHCDWFFSIVTSYSHTSRLSSHSNHQRRLNLLTIRMIELCK